MTTPQPSGSGVPGWLSASIAVGWTLPLRPHQAEIELSYAHGLADIAKSSELERLTRSVEMLGTLRW